MKRILIFYSHFAPAFKAGGPVQSLRNMVQLIKDDFIVDVVCSAFELGGKELLPGIMPDEWNTFDKNVNVLYIKTRGVKKIKEVFAERKPDVVYVNGVFLPLYSWYPLGLSKIKSIATVFAPRGMLQEGAIASGAAKKMMSISLMKAFGLHKNTTWHATDEQEKRDILHRFDKNGVVIVVNNVPKPPLVENSKLKKQQGELRLVFLSLIARKKNLDLVLTNLKAVERSVVLDIYGPIKDKAFWQECLALMRGQKHHIRYCGPVSPADVQSTLKNYHAFILPTKGENFGHAIYESLSVGTPVIISQFTPWGQVQDRNAGITVDIHDEKSIVSAIDKFLDMDQKEFDKLSEGAFDLAHKYYNSCDFKSMYIDLFTNTPVLNRSEIEETIAVSKK